MEKKRDFCPYDPCEKFFKAITVRSTTRRMSHHHQDSMPTNPSPNPMVKTHHSAKHTKTVESAQQHKNLTNKETAEVVPIKFLDSGLPSATSYATVQNSRKGPISQLAQAKTMHKAEIAAQAQQKYKNKADNARPSPTHAAVGYGHQGVKTNGKVELPQGSRNIESNKIGANMEDKFTEYINRAGNKIRTTSGVNGKNNPSASEEGDSKDHFSDYITRTKKKMLRTLSGFVGGRSGPMK